MIWQRELDSITTIVVHCSDTPDGYDYSILEVDRWHRVRAGLLHPSAIDPKVPRDAPQPPVDIAPRLHAARRRHKPELLAIGYHVLIHPTGQVESCRALDEIGSHARGGYNLTGAGICMLGRRQFTVAAWASLKAEVSQLRENLPTKKTVSVIGHTDVPGCEKKCPGFDVFAWLGRGMVPAAENVI